MSRTSAWPSNWDIIMFQWVVQPVGIRPLKVELILMVGTYMGQDFIWACTPFDPETFMIRFCKRWSASANALRQRLHGRLADLSQESPWQIDGCSSSSETRRGTTSRDGRALRS